MATAYSERGLQKESRVRVLVFGGTRFAGSFFVEMAVAAGHRVTVFHRGITGAAPAGAHTLLGDRDPAVGRGLEALAGSQWDAVVDFSTSVPAHLEASIQSLGAVGRYIYVSSVSAYADLSEAGCTESWALAEPAPVESTVFSWEHYAALKSGCEARVRKHFGQDAWILRPGLIAGPRDHTDRMSWWPWRVAQGGHCVAPLDACTQFIDARDLARFLLTGLEKGLSGVHNVVGTSRPLAQVLDHCRALCERPARPVWMDGPWLEAQGVAPWSELPLWTGSDPADFGFCRVDGSKALSDGLVLRGMDHTLADTLAWLRAHRPDGLATGLDPTREATLIQAWRART